jgi:hypothetical protein
LPESEGVSISNLSGGTNVKDVLRGLPGVDLVRPVATIGYASKASIDLVGELLRMAAGDDLLELGADLARAFSFFLAILAVAMERCSCDIGVNRISRGSRTTSTGPMGDMAFTFTRNSNRISAKSVFKDSPIGH